MGVALIADRRLTNRDGSQPEYGDKITGEIWGMLTAFSGDRGTFELFRNRLRHYVRTSKKDEEQSNQKLHNSDIDEILWQIHKIKTEVTYQKGGYKFELMVGVSSQYFAHKKSVLDYFSVDGGISQ
jgi:hypothetical protein